MCNPDWRSRRSHGRVTTLRHAGASLVELLVGMTVGLMVIAGAIGIMETARGTSATISDLSQLQQQGSFALRIIGMQVRQAGSIEPVQGAGNGLFSFSNGSVPALTLPVVSGTEGSGSDTDTVSVSHQPASKASQGRDCLGELIAGLRAESTFFVTNAELKCRTAGKNQALIGNVADFQVWYRVRSAPDGTQRMTAEKVEAAALWDAVKSIEVCLHLVGNEVGHPESGNVTGCQGQSLPRKGRLHLVLHNVFDLRSKGV